MSQPLARSASQAVTRENGSPSARIAPQFSVHEGALFSTVPHGSFPGTDPYAATNCAAEARRPRHCRTAPAILHLLDLVRMGIRRSLSQECIEPPLVASLWAHVVCHPYSVRRHLRVAGNELGERRLRVRCEQ